MRLVLVLHYVIRINDTEPRRLCYARLELIPYASLRLGLAVASLCSKVPRASLLSLSAQLWVSPMPSSLASVTAAEKIKAAQGPSAVSLCRYI